MPAPLLPIWAENLSQIRVYPNPAAIPNPHLGFSSQPTQIQIHRSGPSDLDRTTHDVPRHHKPNPVEELLPGRAHARIPMPCRLSPADAGEPSHWRPPCSAVHRPAILLSFPLTSLVSLCPEQDGAAKASM